MGYRGDHPDGELLARYGSGQVTELELAEVEAHVLECDICCLQLESLAVDPMIESLRQSAWTEGAYGDTLSALWQTDPTPSNGSSPDAEREAKRTPLRPAAIGRHPRYRLKRLLGTGGMATVYLAEHRLMKRDVALKVIHRELFDRADVVERFLGEVQMAARLSHPHVVTAYDADRLDGTHLLVMEFVDGETLARIVEQNGPMSWRVACEYICQAALGLEHAHRLGLVHRDIKPQNLMLSKDNCVKVLDFGLASLVASEVAAQDVASEILPDDRRLTHFGSKLGTPAYMAPEQLVDPRRADIRADIYSLGCTLHFLLQGVPPAVLRPASDAAGSVRPEVPPTVEDVVRRMTAADPADRFATPGEVAAALSALVGAPSGSQRAKSSRWHGASVVAAGAIGLTAVALLLMPPFKGVNEPDAQRPLGQVAQEPSGSNEGSSAREAAEADTSPDAEEVPAEVLAALRPLTTPDFRQPTQILGLMATGETTSDKLPVSLSRLRALGVMDDSQSGMIKMAILNSSAWTQRPRWPLQYEAAEPQLWSAEQREMILAAQRYLREYGDSLVESGYLAP